MAKIGRNDPCPCGSGKKFKKCCEGKSAELVTPPLSQPVAPLSDKPGPLSRLTAYVVSKLAGVPPVPPDTPKYRGVRVVHWGLAEVRELSTAEIIRQLHAFGVPFTQEQFLLEVKRFYSACELARHWQRLHPITAAGFDIDFIWIAAMVLWERLAPDVVNSEMLDDLMQSGYDLLEKQQTPAACQIWLQVWEHLKPRFRPELRSIDEAEVVFSGLQCLSNWCGDLEMELGNAGLEDPAFYEKRIRYCREFYTLFPASDPSFILSMKRAEAESLFDLGRVAEGERAFAALTAEFPDSVWGFIGWGDMYSGWCRYKALPLDLAKAERLYRLALGRGLEDEDVVLERLADLEKERQKHQPQV